METCDFCQARLEPHEMGGCASCDVPICDACLASHSYGDGYCRTTQPWLAEQRSRADEEIDLL